MLFALHVAVSRSVALRQGLLQLLLFTLFVFAIATTASSAAPVQVLAIHAGGGAAGSFVADADYSGGSTYSVGTTIDTSGAVNPAPQAVYQTERYGNFTYTLPGLTSGTSYTLRLHFAEIFYSSPNQRQFNVLVNGTQVLTNFDIVAAAGGPNKAVVESFPATANSSGQIVVQFANGAADNAKIDGLEVLTTGNPVPVGLTATPGDGQVLLTWQPVSGATGYNVYHSTSSGGEGTTAINASPTAANAYIDTGLSAGTAYYYTVAAVFASSPQSPQSAEASATTSASSALQDANWIVTEPSGFNVPAPVVSSTSNSVSASIGTTLSASANVGGATTNSVTISSEAKCSGTWTFMWTGSTWPTLYVIKHQQKLLYSASVNSGTGSAQVANTGGNTLVSAAYPPTGTQIRGMPLTSSSFKTTDLTQPSFTSATTVHSAGNMPAPGQALTLGQSTGPSTGWSEISNTTTSTQTAYTQAWFQSHFSSPNTIVLSFTVPASDVTVTSSISNSTSQGSASALGTVADFYAGS